jgi:hypothetical protein
MMRPILRTPNPTFPACQQYCRHKSEERREYHPPVGTGFDVGQGKEPAARESEATTRQ